MTDIQKLQQEAFEFEMRGKINNAISTIKKILEINPENIQQRLKLGDLFYVIGKIDESVNEFEKICETKPDFTYALYRLGISYFRATKNY